MGVLGSTELFQINFHYIIELLQYCAFVFIFSHFMPNAKCSCLIFCVIDSVSFFPFVYFDVQLACCCGSAACSCCCNCCPKIKQSTGTRIMYAVYFLLVTFICGVMMYPTVEEEMRKNVSTPMIISYKVYAVLFCYDFKL